MNAVRCALKLFVIYDIATHIYHPKEERITKPRAPSYLPLTIPTTREEVEMDNPIPASQIESVLNLDDCPNIIPKMQPTHPSKNYIGDWTANNIILAGRKHFNLPFNILELHIIIYILGAIGPNAHRFPPGVYVFVSETDYNPEAGTKKCRLPTQNLVIDESDDWTLATWARMTATTVEPGMERLREIDVHMMAPKGRPGQERLRAVGVFAADKTIDALYEDRRYTSPAWYNSRTVEITLKESFELGVWNEIVRGFWCLRQGVPNTPVREWRTGGEVVRNEMINEAKGKDCDEEGAWARQMVRTD